MNSTDFFQTSGTLERGHPSYVERSADVKLLQNIEEGELSLVLAPRQTGKSSLMVHALEKLEAMGIQWAIVDLQFLGSHSEPALWYRDIIHQIQRSLGLSIDCLKWWDEHDRLGPTERFRIFIEDVVLVELNGRVVIFFDEIDSVLPLAFSDDFFTTLRAIVNFRSSNINLKKVIFILIGLATSSELIKNKHKTPFNVGKEIYLNDFNSKDLSNFKSVLGPSADYLIERIIYWTEGQPLMVQAIAKEIYDLPINNRTIDQIDSIVRSNYLFTQIEKDTHLGFIQNYLLNKQFNISSMLSVYKSILSEQIIQYDKKSIVHERLLLSGIVRVKNGKLVPRNRIYQNVFDLAWIADNIPQKNVESRIVISDSHIGVIGDSAVISGGIHFHNYPDRPGDEEPARENPPDPQASFDPFDAAAILHISDLHFGADRASDPMADANRWYGRLTDDLTLELGCEKLRAVIISGDIGNFSTEQEYRAAQSFLEQLCHRFQVGPDRVIMVPGNHDLDWKISKHAYHLMDEEAHDGPLNKGHYIRISDEVIRLRDETAYPRRFRTFGRFHEKVTGRPYPLDPRTQVTFHHLPELNLVIVGFNSAWEVDHHFKSRVSINPDALAHALDLLREADLDQGCRKIAVWHHPLSSPKEDRIKDQGFMQWLAARDFSVCLHGHIHKAEAGLFRYDMSTDGRRIHVIGAGTFGAPAGQWTPGYPLQYNLLRLASNLLRVETRRRIDPGGTWEPDHLWRQGRSKPNLPYYDIPLSDSGTEKPSEPVEPPTTRPAEISPSVSGPDLETEIKTYRAKAESLHAHLPVAGFASQLKANIDIDDIYVPLRAMMNLRGIDDPACFGDALEAEKHLAGCDAALDIPLIEAFEEAQKRGQKNLVILGDPGSGKTTHMKRILLWCLRKGPETMGLPPDMLPVFLPLRDLASLDHGLDQFIQDQLASRHLKTRPDFGRRLLARGNLLFLLDGLDEVADIDRRRQVTEWIEEAFTDYPDCRFVITCRFAGYTSDVRLGAGFLEMHVRPLSEDQAEQFIHNWYAIVEKSLAKDVDQAAGIAREKAEALIERLREKDFRARRVFELTRNPLLLTNICLVHRHRGTLPQRRARLYEECIDVLLEHWRGAKHLAMGVNALRGRQVLGPVALWLHEEEDRTRATAGELAPIIDPLLADIQWTGGDARRFLEIIRDESGLLTGWDQENYGFMHLGFQEYLAAREIRSRFQQEMNENGKSNMLKELAARFGQSWWQEVILLLLALEDPPLFVPFMREVVRRRTFAKHGDLVEMCLDDAVRPTTLPFMELLKAKPGDNKALWQNQLLVLRILQRLDEEALKPLMNRLQKHPYGKIRQLVRSRSKVLDVNVTTADFSGYELVFISGGTFMMGSNEYKSEQPVHKVTIPDFYMGRYPVTNAEYGRFLAATGYREPEYWANRDYNQPSQPVVGVSWHDAQKFAQWAGLQLPTEAQWEYACRAGTTTRYYTGDEEAALDRAGWYKRNSGGKLHPVGEKEPNAFGLYDMHGNVWEWCEDHWHSNYEDAPSDGRAWVDKSEGDIRVLRGGSWFSVGGFCRSAFRDRSGPSSRLGSFGFRLSRGQTSQDGAKAIDSAARRPEGRRP